MFGFLNPRPHTPDYRRAYARVCQHQRANFGVRSLPFHSYEAVFLYQLALDLGAFPAAAMPHVRCCRLAKPANLHRAADAAVGQFCGGVGVLLASIKLDDDVRDAKGFITRLSRRAVAWALRRKIHAARAMFADLDPRFAANVRQLIADHHRLEQLGEPISVEEYTEPTANAFGYVFSRMAKLNGLGAHENLLMAVGRHVGAALIAFDCAVDWRRDRRRGEFNPLPDEDAVHAAMVFCLSRLRQAETLIRAEVTGNARSAATLARVQQRLLELNPLAAVMACPTPARNRAARVRLPMLASAGTPDSFNATDPEPNPPLPNEGARPELPGGEVKVNKRKKGCDCCDAPACDGCCEAVYCGWISSDCCAGAECGACGGEACCAAAECGDCSC